ncbi:MAG: hypothetical protein LW884_04390 [Bacteroidetes bacterium]|jgi:hypothetical protein|nr:hypothetical protein [Bacteroidota bacterium]
MKQILAVLALAIPALVGCGPDAYREGVAAARQRCGCMQQYKQITPQVYEQCRQDAAPFFQEKATPFKEDKDALMQFNEGYAATLKECGGDQRPE